MSIKKAYYRLSQNFYWPGAHGDMEKRIIQCKVCQKRRVPNHPAIPELRPLRVNHLFQIVSVDHVGPLTQQGTKQDHPYHYICVFVEYLTRFVIAVPTKTCCAGETAEVFLREIIFRYGPCDTILSDRHKTFRSTTCKDLMNALGITTKFTTSYHAQTNGLVERNNQQIKVIMSATMESHADWPNHVAVPQFLINSTPCATTGKSPVELVLGRPPAFLLHYGGDVNNGIASPVVGKILEEIASTTSVYRSVAAERMDVEQRVYTDQYNIGKNLCGEQFQEGDLVLMKDHSPLPRGEVRKFCRFK